MKRPALVSSLPRGSSSLPRLVYLANARSVFTVRWANYFANRDWEVHIITWHVPHNESMPLPSVGVWTTISPPVYALRWLALGEIIWLLRYLRPDIVHGHYLRTFGTLAGLSSYVRHACPVVVSGWGPHGLLHCGQPLRFLIRMAVAGADKVTVSTEYLASILERDYGVCRCKLHCHSWGVDTDLFSPSPPLVTVPSFCDELLPCDDVPVVFSPRTAAPHYRIDVLIRAIHLLHTRGQAVHLVIATGVGARTQYVAMLRELVRKTGLCGAITVVEHPLSEAQMARLYRRAAATVSIPIDDQFGASVLEAMACGSVPIVSRLPAYRQYLRDGENTLYVWGDDPVELAGAIDRVLADAALRRRCADANPAIIRKHENWNRNAEAMEQLYLGLLQARMQ